MESLAQLSQKKLSSVLIESTVVGVSLAVLVKLVKNFVLQYIPDISGNKEGIELLVTVGFLFHMICEYTGVNLWYAKEYCKLI